MKRVYNLDDVTFCIAASRWKSYVIAIQHFHRCTVSQLHIQSNSIQHSAFLISDSDSGLNIKKPSTQQYNRTTQYKTRNEMQCNEKKLTINQGENGEIGILGGRDDWWIKDLYQLVQLHGLGHMVALLSRDVISVSRTGGNRWRMQLDGLSNCGKKSRQSLLRLSHRDGSSAYCNVTQLFTSLHVQC